MDKMDFRFLAIVLVMLSAVAGGIYRQLKRRRTKAQGRAAEGKVIDITTERDAKNNDIYFIVYEYADIFGARWTGKVQVPRSTAQRAKGRTLEVYYQTEQPGVSVIGDINLESNITCPTCGCQEVSGAYIEDGSWGDWCPRCKMSLQKMARLP